MREIIRHYRDKLNEYQDMLYELCERILKNCTDSVMKRSAVKSICMICREEDIGDWLNQDTTFVYEDRHEIYEERYQLLGDTAQYEMCRDANCFLRISRALGRLKSTRSYRGAPEKSIAWNNAYLYILDASCGHLESEKLPDGCIAEYISAYMSFLVHILVRTIMKKVMNIWKKQRNCMCVIEKFPMAVQ